MKAAFTILGITLAFSSCSHNPAHAGSSPDVTSQTRDHLVFAGGGESFDAQVTASSLIGARVNLARGGGGIRGEAFNEPVNLSVDASRGRVGGVVGTRPMQFAVQAEGGAQHLQGLVNGQVSDFRLSPQDASGRLGPCSYQLMFTGGAYEGSRNCGGAGVQPMELRIPQVMASWSPADRMAALALFLIAR